MKKFKMISLAVVSVLVLIVVLQNTDSVETKILFVTLTMPRAFLLLVTFLIGFVVGAVSLLGLSSSHRKDIGDIEKP